MSMADGATNSRELQLKKWKKRAAQVYANNSRQMASAQRRANRPGATNADRQRLKATEGQMKRAQQAIKELNAVNNKYSSRDIIAIGSAGTISEQSLKQSR